MNQPIAMNTTRKHVVWLDVVRLVAMFTVVCCHSADRSTFTPANRQPTLMKSNSGEPPTEPFSVRVSHCLS